MSGLVNFRTQFAPGYAYPAGKAPVLTRIFWHLLIYFIARTEL